MSASSSSSSSSSSEAMEEVEEFPILCETCLGDNPHVRMTKLPFGGPCKICERPFTVFRWKAGTMGRMKKTELCSTCAKLKNVCQTCILDLQYGLPVAVRDAALAAEEKIGAMPSSQAGKQWMVEQYESQLEKEGRAALPYDKMPTNSKILEKLARNKTPYYKRNEAHLCSFYVRGQCTRGELCPYRHEMPTNRDLIKSNFKDRFFGSNDPVAKKLLGKMNERDRTGSVADLSNFPSDPNIHSFFIANLENGNISEQQLKDYFHKYGDIQNVKILTEKGIGFVTFRSRVGAEEAAKRLTKEGKPPVINGNALKVAWAKPKGSNTANPGAAMLNNLLAQAQQAESSASASSSSSSSFNSSSGSLGSSSSSSASSSSSGSSSMRLPAFPNLPPPPGMNISSHRYPSQDPKSFGARFTSTATPAVK